MLGHMTHPLVVTLLAVTATACNTADAPPVAGVPPTDAKSSASAPATVNAALPDLSQSLDGVRAAFNDRSKEARFLALLAPT